jgi:hypothetical protein
MNMFKQKFLIPILVLACLSFSSVLSNLANTLSARHWGKMPTNASLAGLDLFNSLLYWTDSGAWDPIHHRLRWVGGPGTCCANPADYKLITYDEATDTWTVQITPFSGSGHSYDGNAYNPVAGVHYFGLMGSPNINIWNDTSWSTLPTAPFGATTPSITWFPDINNRNGGLVFLSDGGNLAWFDGSAWHRLAAFTLGGIDGFTEYNPVLKKVWVGGEDTKTSYLLDTNLILHKCADAPVSLGNGTSLHTCDPVSGNFLVYIRSAQIWYEYNPVTDTWSRITDMLPVFSFGTTADLFHVPIPEYGVILFFDFSWPSKSIYLYRHAVPAAAEKKEAVAGFNTGLEVSPNPAHTFANISLKNFSGEKKWRLEVFREDGRRVAELSGAPSSLKEGVNWNAAGQPAGVYLIKVIAGSDRFYKRVIMY